MLVDDGEEAADITSTYFVLFAILSFGMCWARLGSHTVISLIVSLAFAPSPPYPAVPELTTDTLLFSPRSTAAVRKVPLLVRRQAALRRLE